MTEARTSDDREATRVKEPERTDSQNAKAETARRAGLPEDERNSYTTPTE